MSRGFCSLEPPPKRREKFLTSLRASLVLRWTGLCGGSCCCCGMELVYGPVDAMASGVEVKSLSVDVLLEMEDV